MPSCCCAICQERLSLLEAEASGAKQLKSAYDALQADRASAAPREKLAVAVNGFLGASEALKRFEVKNGLVLGQHMLLGAAVSPMGIVDWEPLMPGTEYYHDWIDETVPGESVLHTRRCRNCGITYHKVDDDPRSHSDWQEGIPV